MRALIAGQGALPQRVAAAFQRWPMVVALEGNMPDTLIPELTFRIETLGTLFHTLRERGVTEVAFAGSIKRPQIDSGAIDMATAPLVPKIIGAMRAGDDGAARVVIDLFEDAGFQVLGIADALPDLILAPGVPTKAKPGSHVSKDADRAAEIVAAMGVADVGQSCVVVGSQALAIEGVLGTEWMLGSLTVAAPQTASSLVEDVLDQAADWLSGPAAPPRMERVRDPALPKGGILYKAPKAGQEMRIDMPAIGPDTMTQAAEAGVEGIVIVAGGVMVLDPARTISLADEHGLFLWVRD